MDRAHVRRPERSRAVRSGTAQGGGAQGCDDAQGLDSALACSPEWTRHTMPVAELKFVSAPSSKPEAHSMRNGTTSTRRRDSWGGAGGAARPNPPQPGVGGWCVWRGSRVGDLSPPPRAVIIQKMSEYETFPPVAEWIRSRVRCVSVRRRGGVDQQSSSASRNPTQSPTVSSRVV